MIGNVTLLVTLSLVHVHVTSNPTATSINPPLVIQRSYCTENLSLLEDARLSCGEGLSNVGVLLLSKATATSVLGFIIIFVM
jgi:hypothetical protein